MAAVLNHSNFDPSDWTDIEDILSDLDHEETIHHYTPHAMAAFKCTTKDPNLPNYSDAMSSDNSKDYHDVMKGEVDALMKRAMWELINSSAAQLLSFLALGHFNASDAPMVASENSKHDTV